MKNNTLFVLEKHCDADPNMGLTNNFHNLISTFSQSCPDYKLHTLHIDEAVSIYKSHIDNILVDYCAKFDINIVIFSLIGGSSMNPSFETYKKLRELGVYLIFMWPDTGNSWGGETIKQIGGIANLHISWDNPKSPYHDNYPKFDNHLFLWVPEDPTLFYKQDIQDIDVSFIGSPRYYDRGYFINYLLGNYPSVVLRGGQREEKLTPSKYAELIRRSKISLNFSLSPAMFFQTKGRIFEVTASNSMLLEFRNPSTSSLYQVDTDYVDFSTPEELVAKIKFYLENESERSKIALSGYNTYNNNYTSQKFWDTIMNRVQKELK